MKPWKIQKFFEDVVYDLRNRGLLPVVILLVVALVAVPVLISRGGSDSVRPTRTARPPARLGAAGDQAGSPRVHPRGSASTRSGSRA